MKTLLLLLSASAGFAQIQRPQLGAMLDGHGDLRPVSGTAASASLGDSLAAGVASFACSAQLCLWTATPAVIALDGDAAYIYRPETQTIARWAHESLTQLDFAPGEILSIRATADGFDYAVRSGGFISVEHFSTTDSTVTRRPVSRSPGPVLLFNGGVLLAEEDRIRVLRDDASKAEFLLRGARQFFALGEDSIEIVAPGGRWILRTARGAESLSLLPGDGE